MRSGVEGSVPLVGADDHIRPKYGFLDSPSASLRVARNDRLKFVLSLVILSVLQSAADLLIPACRGQALNNLCAAESKDPSPL